MIIETEPVNSNLCQVVLHLASFHMEMSFIGSIRHLMAESWLKKLVGFMHQLQLGTFLLVKLLHAIAVKAHLLIDAALNTLILSKALRVSIPDLEVEANATDVNDARAEEEAMEALRRLCSVRRFNS